MESRELRNFVAAAQHASFREAASDLHLSQPALSRQIQALEQRLGVELFDRSRRGVTLTGVGWVVYRRTQAVLAALDRLSDACADPANEVLIGYHDAGAISFVPGLLRLLADIDDAPTVRLVPRFWSRRDAGVAEGLSDLGVVRSTARDTGIRRQILYVEPRVVAVPGSSSYADDKCLAAQALTGAVDVESPVEDLGVELWRRLRADRLLRPETVEEALAAVAAGHVAVLPVSVAALHPRPGLTYVKATDAGQSVVNVVWREEHMSPQAADILAIIRSVAVGLFRTLWEDALEPRAG